MQPKKIKVRIAGKKIKIRGMMPSSDEEVEALQYLERKYIELKDLEEQKNLKKQYDMSFLDFVNKEEESREDENHMLSEIDALFAVALGYKSISTFSYLNEYYSEDEFKDEFEDEFRDDFEKNTVNYFQKTVGDIMRKLFKGQLDFNINNSKNIIFFNPSDKFSVFAMNLVMNSNTEEYNLSKNQFERKCDFNLEYVKSVVLGYGKWTTVYHNIMTEAGKMAYEKTGKETGRRYKRRLQRYIAEMKADETLVDQLSREYDCAREVVLEKYMKENEII